MSKRLLFVTAVSLSLLAPYMPATADAPPSAAAEDKARAVLLTNILKTQHPQSGDVKLLAAKATLRLGDQYYFLDAVEAKKVLVDGWGNRPESVEDVLGLVLPKGKTFLDDTWGAVLTYDQSGYVADDDAKSTDYAELLQQMQSGEEEINKDRTAAGYDAQHLVGWAEQPVYDAASHSVVWAQNIKFGNQTDNSLNYDVRMLGRHGVLSLNLVSSMSRLAEIKQVAKAFSQSASFDSGARYADFNKDTDKLAEYGVGGLVAAGLGVVAAKKLGFLAILLAFGKKGIIVIGAALYALRSKITGFFRRNKDPLEGDGA
jgi:uncharacterized membrane-anchored protein